MRAILFVLLLLVSSVSYGGDADVEIRQLLKEQDDAWNRGDLDGFIRPYDDTNHLVFLSTVEIRSSKELKERYEKRYKSGKADFGKLSFSQLQVEELAPGLARAWGRWTVEENSKRSSGWFTLILQKKADQWRIIHDHSS
ncbi:nuclear transport factor 2 family protein [bacterium]|nr:nuclear transport factor 2 family protein [bacterium]MCI0606260.1 nuclear transport factor 2 family protein [bacterium]